MTQITVEIKHRSHSLQRQHAIKSHIRTQQQQQQQQPTRTPKQLATTTITGNIEENPKTTHKPLLKNSTTQTQTQRTPPMGTPRPPPFFYPKNPTTQKQGTPTKRTLKPHPLLVTLENLPHRHRSIEPHRREPHTSFW